MNKKMLEQLSNYTVLYAEDDEGVRNSVAEMLNLLFKKVYIAKNGEEAYALFLEKSPHIIITDIKMPIINGIELAKKIRQSDENIQIIVISAYTQVDYMLDAIDLSLMKYIVKPITETKLCEALEKFLQLQKNSNTIHLVDSWVYDSSNKTIRNEQTEYELTKKESSLLELLLSKKSVLTYEEIEMELWPDETMSLNALRLLMKNFRKKLPEGYLKNIQSIGYKL
ncbi:response regulator [Sulfurospirillum arcachonense]|uniref:response regulator n=1 Tax=Sulfurospirillum arcachonense TaxID=57666 RepID=UPI00046A1340|nr:response regulator [Sulfurospirillum arcachonense]